MISRTKLQYLREYRVYFVHGLFLLAGIGFRHHYYPTIECNRPCSYKSLPDTTDAINLYIAEYSSKYAPNVLIYQKTGVGNLESTVQVRISNGKAYVRSSDNTSPEVVIDLPLGGTTWVPLLSSSARYCDGGGSGTAKFYVYPIVYANNSNVSPAEIATSSNTIPLSTKGVISDDSTNVYQRYISFDNGIHYTAVNADTAFTVTDPGTSAKIKFALGGTGLRNLSKVRKSILYAY